jgi:hypothetical protein
MERGGIKILPITTKDVRNELLTHSTTFTRPTWLVVSQQYLPMVSRSGYWYLWLLHRVWYDYRLGSMEPDLQKRFIWMLSI